MYIHYNPNPRGLRVGDCAVRAASKAAGETWGSTYAALCALGYDCGDMPNANHVWGRYLHERGFTRHALPDSERRKTMSMTSELSASDVALLSGRNSNQNGDGFFGGNGAYWIIILFLFVFCGWGNNGWGGFGNRNGGQGSAVDGYVLTSDFANIERKIDNVNNGLCDGFYAQAQLTNGVQMQMANGFAQAELARANQQTALMQQLNAMQAQAADCCCKTQTAIQGVNYNLATQACDTRNTIQSGVRDILDNANANARAVIDALTAQRIEAKDEKIAAQNQQIFGLQLAASQAAQNQYLVNTIRPCPVPAYTVANPFCCNQAQYCAG